MVNAIQNQKKAKVYDVLYQDLKSDILSGKLDFTVPILGELDLAEKYNISRKSVRKALQLLTDEDLLRKVPGHGTYAKAPEERSDLKTVECLTIGVILPWDPAVEQGRSEYGELFLEGVSAYAFRQNHRIKILQNSIDFKTLKSMYNRHEISGIIWDRPKSELHTDIIMQLLAEQIPVLTVNRIIGNSACLLHDYHTELSDSVAFLHSIGHQKIAFLNFNAKEVIFEERKKAFFTACEKLALNSNYCETSFVEFAENIEVLFKESNPSALILGGCGFMYPLLQWVENKKLRFPEDFSLLALDDSYMAKSNSVPITVFAEPRFETGKQAGHCLEMLVKGQVKAGEQFKIKGSLIARKSCASPKSRRT